MTITLVWRGTDRDGEALPLPPKWPTEQFDSRFWMPATGHTVDVHGTAVYVTGVKITLASDKPLHCDAYVVPMP